MARNIIRNQNVLDPPKPRECVYTLMIEHRHGTDTRVFRTDEGARAALLTYVREWWAPDEGRDDALTQEDFDALPPNEQIEEYFEHGPGYEESFYLDSATVED